MTVQWLLPEECQKSSSPGQNKGIKFMCYNECLVQSWVSYYTCFMHLITLCFVPWPTTPQSMFPDYRCFHFQELVSILSLSSVYTLWWNGCLLFSFLMKFNSTPEPKYNPHSILPSSSHMVLFTILTGLLRRAARIWSVILLFYLFSPIVWQAKDIQTNTQACKANSVCHLALNSGVRM